MATYYWVGGTGTWDNSNTANWSNASGGSSGYGPPTGSDDVVFDGSSGGGIVSIAATATSKNCTISASAIYGLTGSPTLTTGTLSVTSAGTFYLYGYTLSVNAFSCTGSSAFTFSFGAPAGVFNVTGNNATVYTVTNANFSTGFYAINLTYSGSTGTRTINCTNSGMDINVTAGSDTVTFTANNAIRYLDFTGFAGSWSNVPLKIYGNLTVSSGMTVGAGTNLVTFSPSGAINITSNGKTLDFPVIFQGGGTVTLIDNLTVGSTKLFTLYATNVSLGSNVLSCGKWYSWGAFSKTITHTTGSIEITGNDATVLINATSAITCTGVPFKLVYSGSTGTRAVQMASGDVTGSGTFSIYVTAGSDTFAFYDDGSIDTYNTFAALDFTGFTGTWANNFVVYANGSITVSSGMTVGAGTNTVTFINTGTLTTNGKTLDFPLTISASGKTVTLGDDLTLGSARTLTLTFGTLTAGSYAVNINALACSGTGVRTLALGSGTWAVSGSGAAWNCGTSTGLTVTGTGKISMTSASAKTFAGGGKTWPILENAGAGALTVTGSNTFTTLTNGVAPTTFTFTSGTTQTVTNFNIDGTSTDTVTLNSSSAGTRATLSKSSGVDTTTYCSIKDLAATGGANWYAPLCTDAGNNTGWIFNTSNFFAFIP